MSNDYTDIGVKTSEDAYIIMIEAFEAAVAILSSFIEMVTDDRS